jgi:small-conductance mechanosensitive channel
LRYQIVRRLQPLAEKTSTQLDDLVVQTVQKTKLLVLIVVALYIGSLYLDLSDGVRSLSRGVLMLVLLIQVGVWGNGIIRYLVEHYLRIESSTDESDLTASASALSFIGKLLLWSIIALLGLENLGVDVTALVASFGLGGIAVALAAQNILGDLFASLSILFDKPFVVGDFIVVDDKLGTVEKIGLKTTRVKSLQGEQLIFSNSDLLKSRIRNFKRMEERRIAFTIGVTYQTPHQKLERIPAMIQSIIESLEQVRFDRAHFKQYADSSLEFEIVYWVNTPDFVLYMEAQQKINLEIYKQFEREGIEFAYPTRTVFMLQPEAATSKDGDHDGTKS